LGACISKENEKVGVSDRIRAIADAKSLTLKDLGEQTDTSYRTLQNYISDQRSVGSEFLGALSEKMGVSATWVLTGIGPMLLDAQQPEHSNFHMPLMAGDFAQVPRYAVEASAGPGLWVDDEETSGYYAFNRKWLARRGLSPNNLAVIAVRGDSMEPKLRSGDLILIDRSQTDIADGLAYVIRIDNDLLVKSVQRTGAGRVALLSANTFYPPREMDISALGAQIEVVGRVVASMQEW